MTCFSSHFTWPHNINHFLKPSLLSTSVLHISSVTSLSLCISSSSFPLLHVGVIECLNFSHLHLSLCAVPWWSVLSLWLQVYSQYTWLTNLNCSPEAPCETETFMSAWLLNICLLMTQRHCRYLMSNQTRIPIFLPNLFFFSGTLLQFCKPEIQSYTSYLTLSTP